jgi:hypothetical protein
MQLGRKEHMLPCRVPGRWQDLAADEGIFGKFLTQGKWQVVPIGLKDSIHWERSVLVEETRCLERANAAAVAADRATRFQADAPLNCQGANLHLIGFQASLDDLGQWMNLRALRFSGGAAASVTVWFR